MWYVVGIIVVAVVLILVLGGDESPTTVAADDVGDDGLLVGDTTIVWSSIFEIVVVTRRRLRGTWFGFEVRSDTAGPAGGVVLVGREDGLAERFLANSHRFPGFDHDAVAAALVRKGARSVCYRS